MIVLTAATPWELRPLQSLGVPVWETGVGPVKTKSALENQSPPPPGSIVISAGFAGALQPGLLSGDIIMDPLEGPIELAVGARELAESSKIPFHMGKIHSVNRVITAHGAKRELGESLRAAAVDMETAAIRSWCQKNKATALAIRVILDEIDDPLPEGMPEDTSVLAGARYALSRPSQIPLLISLGLRQRRAMRTLVRFLQAYLPAIPHMNEQPDAEET
ncbi:MAG: hypothetical protein COB53_07210 [Elusimicrobia bacterium]|nr:MAG: hypothetical protein COB53_07210 [Elusimicrobiota bacterium]